VYSETKNCFYCSSTLQISVVLNGWCDWEHLGTALEKHEKSRRHIDTMSTFLELQQRLLEGKAIDYENQLRSQEK
jgi:hypothetical protein